MQFHGLLYVFVARLAISGQQQPHQIVLLPLIQQCLDTITEHQRLKTLMKGELSKGLLPQSTVPAEFTVHRVRGMLTFACRLSCLGNFLSSTPYSSLVFI